MFKKVASLLLAVLMLVSVTALFASCGDEEDTVDLRVGVILVGDETEGYTLAHMNGIETAVKNIKEETGKTVDISYKKSIPESDAVGTNAKDLIASGCSVIISNSYGHQYYFGDLIEKNPDVTFVAMTGDLAAKSGLKNYKNAFTDVYESRYLSGIVAGKKLAELIAAEKLSADNMDGDNYKIGYVGAYDYAEVVSGYTAFFLGIKSVVPNVVMTVKYTNSWFHPEREAAAAEFLMAQGCVIIGQHADSTGAPEAIQKALKAGKSVYSVGYNVDMIPAAPDAALTSATNNWSVYYEYLFTQALEGKEVATDWAEGLDKDAVAITELNPKSVAAGTQEAVNAAIAALKDGSLKVFDCSKFTKNGEHITTYTAGFWDSASESWVVLDEAIKTEGGITYFDESVLHSAPYFDIRIDGITEIGFEAN